MHIHSLYDVPLTEWPVLCAGWGAPVFRAKQIVEWLYKRQVMSTVEMTNVPEALRQKLCESFAGLEGTARVLDNGRPSSGVDCRQTKKLLLELADGECIETVIIPAKDRVTVCVSSQAGCAFGCAFCASGVGGLVRNLSQGEILSQVLWASREIGKSPNNIVFMGTGEPLTNYENVMGAVRVLNDGKAFNIGARHITLSTCGVVPGIERLATEGMQVELSVSLHAPTNAQRDRVMPVNKRWPLEELMAALDRYIATTNRMVTFEYTLIHGFNDSPQDADALVHLIRGQGSGARGQRDERLYRVNLIPLSPVAEFDGVCPPEKTMWAFLTRLIESGVHATLRLSKGLENDAACGQLRLRRRQG